MCSRIALWLLFVLLLASCETRQPDYIVRGVSTSRVSQEQAQSLLVENYLQKQVKPPIDRPLRAKTLILPSYPPSLWKARIEGTVRVRFTIGEDGSALNPTIVGAPPPILAALAIDAVLKWRFEPVTRDGKPASVPLTYEFIFRLE